MNGYWSKPPAKKRSRWGLFLPFIVLFLLIAVYVGYYVVARGVLEKGIDEWIVTERARGNVIQFSDKRMTGFPFRFTLEVDNPVYADPGNYEWKGDHLQLNMQPWNWQHIIARAPGTNRVTDQRGIRHTLELDASSAGSLSWTNEGLNRVGLQLKNASGIVDGNTVVLEGLSLNLAPRDESPADLMVAVQWDRVELDESIQASVLGSDIGPTRLIGEVREFFPAYLDSGGDPDMLLNLLRENGGIEVAQLLVNWGPLQLGGKADVQFRNRVADGDVGVRLDDVDELRQAFKDGGVYTAGHEAILAALEASSADGRFLTLTVKDNGFYFLGQRVAEFPVFVG